MASIHEISARLTEYMQSVDEVVAGYREREASLLNKMASAEYPQQLPREQLSAVFEKVASTGIYSKDQCDILRNASENSPETLLLVIEKLASVHQGYGKRDTPKALGKVLPADPNTSKHTSAADAIWEKLVSPP